MSCQNKCNGHTFLLKWTLCKRKQTLQSKLKKPNNPYLPHTKGLEKSIHQTTYYATVLNNTKEKAFIF